MMVMGWRGYDSSESRTEIVQLLMGGRGGGRVDMTTMGAEGSSCRRSCCRVAVILLSCCPAHRKCAPLTLSASSTPLV